MSATTEHTIDTSRTGYHQCEAIRDVDGEQCQKPGKAHYEGKGWLCGLHALPVERFRAQRAHELREYAAYQYLAFGGLVRSWTDGHLAMRQRDLATIPETVSDERMLTLEAERKAVTEEIARRREKVQG